MQLLVFDYNSEFIFRINGKEGFHIFGRKWEPSFKLNQITFSLDSHISGWVYYIGKCYIIMLMLNESFSTSPF